MCYSFSAEDYWQWFSHFHSADYACRIIQLRRNKILRSTNHRLFGHPWVKAFQESRDAIQDNLRTGQSHVEDKTVQLLASLLDADHLWPARELAAEVWVCHKTVLHILHDILGYCKPHRPRTGSKGNVTTSLDKLSLWTKPGLAHTKRTWNINQMNGSIPVILFQKSAPYTMCCEGDVHCGVWH